MKTSDWVATGIGAVALAGGGIWAATTLPASDEATEPETAYTGSYEPVETETPEPIAEPTEAVETPEPTSAPVTVEPQPSETPKTPEELMREAITYGYKYIDATDDELMSAAYYVCDELAAGVPESEIVAVEGVTEMQNADFVSVSHARLCPDA